MTTVFEHIIAPTPLPDLTQFTPHNDPLLTYVPQPIEPNIRTFEPIAVQRTGPLIIHEKRWYFRLVSGKAGQKRSRALMDDFSLNEIAHHLIICFTPERLPGYTQSFKTKDGTGGRIYAFFDSYLEFFAYMQKFQPTERSFYEIIFGELPQKPHFDIDISLDDMQMQYPGEDLDIVAEIIREAVIMGCLEVCREHGVILDLTRDILLYSSHGPTKHSYHLVLNNKFHDGNKEAKAFYEAVMSKVHIQTQGKYLRFVDKSVYSPRQQFRMVGSQKQGSNRPKIFYERFQYQNQYYTHVYSEDVTDPTIKKLTIVYESLISFISGCTFLPSLIPENPVTQNNLGTLPDLDDAIVAQCLTMLKEKLEACPFSEREVRGHLILLKRHAPSPCPLCLDDDGRSIVHENEHPYMSIIGGKVYWYCRRNQNNDKLLVGYLALTLDELEPLIQPVQEDENGEFMFGDYNIGTPTLPPTNPEIHPIADTEVPTLKIPNIAPEHCIQDVYASTLKIAKGVAQKKYVRREPEDITGQRSFASTLGEITWVAGLY